MLQVVVESSWTILNLLQFGRLNGMGMGWMRNETKPDGFKQVELEKA